MTKKKFFSIVPKLLLAMAAIIFIHISSDTAFAGTVEPSNDYSTSDMRNIQAELIETGSVTLVPGATYYLYTRLPVQSGWHIEATGATIIAETYTMLNFCEKAGYEDLVNFSINGGTWKCKETNGLTNGSSFKFCHANGITLTNMDIQNTNYENHSIELVACKNVLVKNCTITALGTPGKKSVEEQLQIDIAAKSVAPFMSNYPGGSSLYDGKACENIEVNNCTITGCRAICANYTPKEKSMLSKYHKNINILNCTLTGKTSEALALFNTVSSTVSKNTIVTEAPVKRNSYSVGCHFAYFGKLAGKGTIKITNNTIKGGRQAVHVYSHSTTKFKKVVINNNKLYCKNGANNALLANKDHIKKLVTAKNSCYKW
ncbi:MAG: hypothetical protein K6F69_01720 [Treponema sp.]|nr:hypothetical protein [Treponema sp.]